MRRIHLISVIIIALISQSLYLNGQNKRYTVMFYNVENLFDIYDDPNVIDEEFLPDGVKEWTQVKYEKKLANLEKVLYNIAASNRSFPTIIGVSEIENRRVLDDLISMPKLAPANYQIVHYDSPEARGVDVALFYRPDQFKLLWSKAFQPTIPERPDFKTRDILAVCGTIEDELFCFLVNHWSSRRGGAESSEFLRVGQAASVKRFVDSLQVVHPDIKIAVMGDMNDDPNNKSMEEVLGAKEKPSQVEKNGMFNPFYAMLKAGYGSLAYQDGWNIFDNIVINENLLNSSVGELKIQKAPKSKFYGNIFKRAFMLQQSGQYKNYPLRTYSGNTFMDGYSDHLPVYILIGKD